MNGRAILHLVMVTYSVYHALSADGCHPGSVRCGDECTGHSHKGSCTCGKDAEQFNYRDNTSWCCNASDCMKIGRNNDIVCKKGTLLPLTTPCHGECSTEISHYAARQYWGCERKDQCIKIQYVQDGIEHCYDGSDERQANKDFYSPIQWDKLTTCYPYSKFGNDKWPGVKCSGQGLADDCMNYGMWCNERTALKCSELGGRTSVHTEVCSNSTYWTDLPCTEAYAYSYEGKRCTSENSGQCYFPDSNVWFLSKTCIDGSHDTQQDNKINISEVEPKCVGGVDEMCESGVIRVELLLVTSVVTILSILSFT